MNHPAFAFAGFFGALMVVGYFDHQDELNADRHYCEMVSLHKQWIREHPRAIGREAALARPGWPEHRADIDCAALGFFFDSAFSKQ